MLRVVLDTNVVVAGLRSSTGASHQLLRAMEDGVFEVVISTSLITEYADVLSRPGMCPLSKSQINAVLDRFCFRAINQKIYYLWRPFLRDPKDDMVFEAALSSQSSHIVTFNLSDFSEVSQFGIKPILPNQFFQIL